MTSSIQFKGLQFETFETPSNETILEIIIPSVSIPEPLIKSLEKMNLSPSQVEEVVGCAITHTQMNYLKDHRYTGERP